MEGLGSLSLLLAERWGLEVSMIFQCVYLTNDRAIGRVGYWELGES